MVLFSLLFFSYDYRNPLKMSNLEKILNHFWKRVRQKLVGPLIITHEFSSSIKAKHIYLPRAQTILKEHQRYFSVLLSRMKKFLLTWKIIISVFLSFIGEICNKKRLLRILTVKRKKQKWKKQVSPPFCFEKKKRKNNRCFFL